MDYGERSGFDHSSVCWDATIFLAAGYDPALRTARIEGMNDLAFARYRADASVAGFGAWLPPLTDACDEGGPERLIHAIATRGDRMAFSALFTRFAPRLKAYLLRCGLDGAVAEELAQDALLIVWRKAAQFDPARASAAAWMFTIARNLRIDASRRARVALAEPDLTEQPSEVPWADAILAAEERGARVRAALAALPAEQADVIRLSFFDDRPHADIERTLGIPLGTVKSRLRLAMSRLRLLFEDEP
jgi:RNA polymerase sigma-70 factor (ECF subfamily)